jgi:hypothetical protein
MRNLLVTIVDLDPLFQIPQEDARIVGEKERGIKLFKVQQWSMREKWNGYLKEEEGLFIVQKRKLAVWGISVI